MKLNKDQTAQKLKDSPTGFCENCHTKPCCSQIGTLAESPFLTPGDIQRIEKGTGFSPSQFVANINVLSIKGKKKINFLKRFMDKTKILEKKDGKLISLLKRLIKKFFIIQDGEKISVLKSHKNGCMFLGPNNLCDIYEHRPIDCHLFPLDIA